MAKFEIQFAGNNSNLKKVIKNTDGLLKELQSTAASVKISIGGRSVNTNLDGINSRLTQTKALLTNISRLSSGINTNLGGSSSTATASQLQQEKLALAEAKTQTQLYRQEVARLQAELAALRLTQGQSRGQTQAASGSYKEAQQRLTALGKAIREAGGGFDLTNPRVKAQVEEYRKLNEQLKSFDRAMGNNQRNVGNYRSALQGLGKNIENLVAGYLSFQSAIAAVGYAFRSSLKTDALEASLNFITGNANQTSAAFTRLEFTADRLGLRYVDLAGSYKSFIGAASASNFSLVEAERIFNSVSNAGGKLKLTSDQMTGALLALQQMISKGNVQAEELRGQLSERLPGAFAIAARAMEVTEAELNKMLKAGEVAASDLLPRLATELDNTFGNDSKEKVESLQGAVNRLFNAFDVALQKGNIAKFFKANVDAATYAIQQLGRTFNPTSFEEFNTRLMNFAGADIIRGLDIAAAQGNKALENSSKLLDKSNASAKEIQLTYNDLAFSYKDAADQLKIYQDAVKKGDISEGGQRNIREYTALVNLLAGRLAQFKTLIPQNLVSKESVGIIERLQKQIKLLEEERPKITNLIDLSENTKELARLQAKLDALNGKTNKVRVEAEKGSFKALQKELSDLQNKAGSAIVGSDTFKQIQALEKRIKVLGDIMKNPVTLSEYLKKNFEAAVKALDKMNFDGLKLRGDIQTGLNIDAIVSGNTGGTQAGQSYQELRGQMLADQDRWAAEASKNAQKSGEDYYQAFSRGVDRFATDFYETLTTLNKETDATFGGIFSTLTSGLFSSIQQVFLGGLTTQLTGLFKDGFKKIDFLGLDNKKLSGKISQALVAGAGLAGGLISGITSPTSSVGQGLGGALSGAAAGAIAGPIGAAVGGAIGLIGGLFGASKARKQQEEIQRQQLAELKKQTELARQSALTFTSAIIGQATNGGIVTGVDRDAFGNLVATIAGRDIKLAMERETAAQLRGL